MYFIANLLLNCSIKNSTLTSVSFQHAIFLVLSYFLALQCFRLILYFSLFQPWHQQFSKEPWNILLQNGFINQVLGTRFAHCYLGVIDLVFVSGQNQNIHIYIYIPIGLNTLKSHQFIVLSIPTSTTGFCQEL